VNVIAVWECEFDLLIPVPPTRYRQTQPVLVLAEAIGSKLGLPVLIDSVKKVKSIPQLKSVYDFEERRKLLTDAYKVDSALVQGKTVLLFDELYRSGATLNAITEVLYDQGKAAEIYVLAVTKTRSRR
jgi:competence protein ComFC